MRNWSAGKGLLQLKLGETGGVLSRVEGSGELREMKGKENLLRQIVQKCHSGNLIPHVLVFNPVTFESKTYVFLFVECHTAPRKAYLLINFLFKIIQ